MDNEIKIQYGAVSVKLMAHIWFFHSYYLFHSQPESYWNKKYVCIQIMKKWQKKWLTPKKTAKLDMISDPQSISCLIFKKITGKKVNWFYME